MRPAIWLFLGFTALLGASGQEFAHAVARQAREEPHLKYLAPTSRDRIGRVWVPVKINGKGPFRFALDTGSDSSAIVASALEKLGIAVPTFGSVRIHGVTGSAVVPSIVVESMTVGSFDLKDVRLPIVDGVFGGADGVLGTRAWPDMRISLDFRKGQIIIFPSDEKAAPPGYTRIPILPTKERLLAIEGLIENLPTKIILDTGAQQSIGNYRLRSGLFLESAEKEHVIKGVTLDIVRGENIAIPPVHLGSIQMKDLHVIFGEMSIFERWNLEDEPVLLLGMDAIGSLASIIIDYKMNEIQILPKR